MKCIDTMEIHVVTLVYARIPGFSLTALIVGRISCLLTPAQSKDLGASVGWDLDPVS